MGAWGVVGTHAASLQPKKQQQHRQKLSIVCEQLLKSIAYPLAHRFWIWLTKKRALLSGVFRSSSLPLYNYRRALSFLTKTFKILFERFGSKSLFIANIIDSVTSRQVLGLLVLAYQEAYCYCYCLYSFRHGGEIP